MAESRIQNLTDIIKKINKNTIVSFLLILVFVVVIMMAVFIIHRDREKKIILQKINTTSLIFATNVTQHLTFVAKDRIFRNYLHSGWISREHNYPMILVDIIHSKLFDMVVGMEVFDNRLQNIFACGEVTANSVTLDLSSLHDRVRYRKEDSLYSCKLYFNRELLIEKMKQLNHELVECDSCSRDLIIDNHFGGFPVLHSTGMKVNLTIKKDSSIILGEMVFFLMSLFLVLIIWNISRIKNIFKKYLSDPLIEITAKIKGNQPLPQVAIEELSYLIMQIDHWQDKVIELEKIKAQEKAQEEKIRIMQLIGASIAHELRTPLRAIASGIAGIERLLPILLKSYHLAHETGLLTEVIKPQQVELLGRVLSNLQVEGAAANTIMDMFLMKMRGTITEVSGVQLLSISACVNEALERYSFQEAERGLIVWDSASDDFQFKGDKILTEHVLFNLLKNALYYIASARKGEITIYLEHGEQENMLYFRDTGQGISTEVLPHVFDKFYSKREGGVGIGLSFCKMAMAWMGGDITCRSVEGEYAEFILHFPRRKD